MRFLIIFFIHIFTVIPFTAASDPDVYETDDTVTQASIIILNNDQVSPVHNFHHEKDEDWVKFYGISGELYIIKAYNPGNGCNPVIQLYDTDSITLLNSENRGIEGEDEIMEWQCATQGVYYVRISHSDYSTFGENTTYRLDLFRPHSCETAVVTGTITDIFSGKSIEGVRIKTDKNDSAISGTGGEYRLVACDFSSTIIFEADEYGIFREIITLRAGEIINRDIMMRPPPYFSLIRAESEHIQGVSYAEWETMGDANVPVNKWHVTIGIGTDIETESASFYPRRYSVKMELWKIKENKWEGPLLKDIREQGKERYQWNIAINPHGNIPPPDLRTSTIHWTTDQLNPTGFYRLRKGYEGNGEIVVDDMRTATTYSIAGKDEVQYFTVEFSTKNTRLRGDTDGNGIIDLRDTVLALKILAGITDHDDLTHPENVISEIDADGDNKIGMSETVYTLQVSADMRP